MADIIFEASFGFERKTVKISETFGGAQGHHIYIDNYYHGYLVKRHGEWVHHANQPWFTIDDVQALAAIIEAEHL